jgi:excisionase family DNA binding protein
MREMPERSATSQNEAGNRHLSWPTDGTVLTVREACDYLRVSKWTLYRLIGRRQIKTMKIGNRRLVRRRSLEAYMDEREDKLG